MPALPGPGKVNDIDAQVRCVRLPGSGPSGGSAGGICAAQAGAYIKDNENVFDIMHII